MSTWIKVLLTTVALCLMLSLPLRSRDRHHVRPSASFRVDIQMPAFGLPSVQARLGDIAGTFVVDTGAERSAIDQQFAQRVGIKKRGLPTLVRAQFALGVRRFLTLDEDLRLGEAVFTDVAWIPADFEKSDFVVSFDGIIGRDVLKHAVIVLEGGARRGYMMDSVSFEKSELHDLTGFESIPISLDARIHIEIDGKALVALVDTGETASVTLARKTSSFVELGSSVVTSRNIFGHSRTQSVGLVSRADLGSNTIYDLAVGLQRDLLPFRRRDALIGNGLFREGTWIIDIGGGTLSYRFDHDSRFDRMRASAMQAPVYYDGSTPELSENFRVVVEAIHALNPLYAELGLSVGDEIVMVDNLPLVGSKDSGYVNPLAFEKLIWFELDALRVRRDGVDIELSAP